MEYLMLLAAVLLLAVSFTVTKLWERGAGASMNRSLLSIILSGISGAVILFAANGFTMHFTWTAFLYATIVSAACMSYTLLGFRVMKEAPLALYTFFLMTGGMTLPYFFGLAFLEEEFSFLRTVGLLLIFGSLFFSGKDGFKHCGWKVLLLCIIIFFLNGTVSIFSKLHQVSPEEVRVSATEFTIMNRMIQVVLAAVMIPFTKPHAEDPAHIPGKLYLWLVIVGVAGSVSCILQLMGAATLPATVCYPIITGGCMILTALAGAIFFKEKLSKRMIICLIVSFIGTCCFL